MLMILQSQGCKIARVLAASSCVLAAVFFGTVIVGCVKT
jgi:hypothetical protein